MTFQNHIKRRCLVIIAVLAITSCAGAQSATTEELHSDLRSALSLASETDLFIGQIERARMLPRFRTAHADYLTAEARRQAKEAHSSAENTSDATFTLCAEQLEQLARALATIRIGTDDKTLAEARGRVETIRKTLIAAGAGR